MSVVSVLLDASIHRVIKLNEQLAHPEATAKGWSIIPKSDATGNYLEVKTPKGATVKKINCPGIYTPPASGVLIKPPRDSNQFPCDLEPATDRIVLLGIDISGDNSFNLVFIHKTARTEGFTPSDYLQVTDEGGVTEDVGPYSKIPPGTGQEFFYFKADYKKA